MFNEGRAISVECHVWESKKVGFHPSMASFNRLLNHSMHRMLLFWDACVALLGKLPVPDLSSSHDLRGLRGAGSALSRVSA